MTLTISSRGPFIQTSGISAGYIGTSGTPRKPQTDKHGAQIVIDNKMQGSCRVWICGDTAMANYAALEVYAGFAGDSVKLVVGASPSLVVNQWQHDFINSRLQNNNTFDIWYDPTPNTFHILRNGAFLFDWVDTSNLVTHGSSKRNVGVVSNGSDRSDDGFYGPGIRKFTFYDR